MKNQYFKNCHLFEFPKNIFVFLWKIRKPHIENRLWWPKMYDRIDDTEKKKIILDRSNTKLLLIIIIIFVLKHFFCHLLSQMCALFWFCALQTYQILIDTQIDLTKLCSNEINTKTCVQNICCCFLIRFRITLVWYVGRRCRRNIFRN